ncbi:hypothetical protein [Nostoc sp. C117]
MWFWEQDSVKYEIFKQYERALVAIGVNFSLEEVESQFLVGWVEQSKTQH